MMDTANSRAPIRGQVLRCNTCEPGETTCALCVLVPALGFDEGCDALAVPIPVRVAAVALGKAVDVDQSLVVTYVNDPPDDGYGVIPVVEIEHG